MTPNTDQSTPRRFPMPNASIASHHRRAALTTRNRRSPVFTADPSGAPIVSVSLGRPEKIAKVDLADWNRLEAAGLSPCWVLNTNGSGRDYVRAKRRGDPRTLVSVAALIANVSDDQQTTYRDGDRTNLRRANLLVEPRTGRRRAAEQPRSEF